MTALELWAELSQRGAVLWADVDRLRYRAPEGAIDDALRAQLGEHKEALLRLLRHDASRTRVSYPLSHGQRALWFLKRLDPDSPAYNTVLAARIHSVVDVSALRQALVELARRHPMLRSTFSDGDAGPMQHVHDQTDVALLMVDGRAWSETQLHAWLAGEARRSFDLEQGPVWRVALVDRPGGQYVLLMVVHHIAVDVLSYMVLIEELRVLYPAARGDKTTVLAAPQVQYSDYVLWQAQWLRSAEAEGMWSYWRERLSGELPVLALPTDRLRPPAQTFRGASCQFSFDGGLILAVRELASSERATLSMALLAAFAAVLQRYTGQPEIVIGSPTTGRTEAQFANVVGFFANAVVLRIEIGADAGFRSLLGHVRQTVVDAQSHQAYPFPLLVQRLQPQRNASRTPLFQVSFTLDRAHWVERLGDSERTAGQAHVDVGGLQLVPMPVAEQEGQFDLALQIIERGDSCSAYLKYNTDLYDETTIERLAGHYVRLLGAAAARPQAPLWSLPLLSEAERSQCEQWNATVRQVVGAQTIHGLVQAQAQRTPERIAVVYEGQSLSYAQLNERADRLAGWLRSVGVGAEALVGVCVERSLDMVVAVLGVLKAGGAYVPLDPTHPRERLELVLEDSGAKVLLTQQALKDRLRASGGRVVCIDTQWHEIAQARLSDRVPVRGQDLAYVMYTSGSTGRPKGVQVEHAAVVNLLGSMSREPGLSADDVLLAVTNLSFDIAGLELFLPLSVGARVVVAASEACVDGTRLARLLAESGASAMQATPVTWRLLLAAGWAGAARLKVLCGGEALPRELAAELLAKAGQVWNLYGPTETTIWSTVHRVSARAGAVPIGRPIANTSVRVLDAHQQLVPVGVWGELYIGGRGVARGYFKRPELTAERFVADPVAPDSGERLYRTGDLVRYLADGSLEFQGRMDDQVKVRGFRIELGEIEAALARHPAVRDQAVVVRADASAEGRLVAYVVLEAESALAELGNFLRMKLPGYMVPAVFVPLAKLPVTPNGKVDRRALPAPAPVRPQLGTGFAAPRDALEQLLAHTYAAVLGVDRVGIHDNFFELGGHSLLAMQVHSRLRQNAGIDLPLHTLFEAPTTADLADAIRSARPVAPGGPDLVPVPRTGKIPLSFAQERLWVLEQLGPGTAAYNFPQAFRLIGSLNVEALRESFREVLRRHEGLRSHIHVESGKPALRIADALQPRLEVTNLRTLPAKQREAQAWRRIRSEACRPFDLERGPLLRTTAIQLDEDEHWVLLTAHHIVVDGWSMGVLVREITALYEAYVEERASPLQPLLIQYPDYSFWQRQWFDGEVRRGQLGYWRRQLAGELPVLQLPADRPRPAVRSYRGASRSFALPLALVDALRALARSERATLFMVLLTGFAALLSRYSGQTDITVGAPSANRNRREVEDLIGLFLNMLVLRADLSGDPSFGELLARMRQVSLDAYAHQDMPFERLVEDLQPQRDRSRTPLFQVVFALQNVPNPVLQLSGLEVRPLELHTGTSKFDLSVSVTEGTDGAVATWEYNTDLYDETTIERLAGHYVRLLGAAAARPQAPLWSLPLLSEAERSQCEQWNATVRQVVGAQTIHGLVQAQAQRTPERIAVVYEGQSLSYAQLNERADRLAGWLRSVGVGAEALVGVCVERSLDMVVAVLGVLKAGGAYVPLDPTHPRERLELVLEDSGAKVLLTQQALKDRLRASGGRVVCIDTQWHEIAQARLSDRVPVRGQDLAYVMYTSGSTGRPKGVQVEHAAVVNLLGSMSREPGLSADDVLLAVTNLSFDIAGLELFLPLSVGARVVVAASEACVDGTRLARLLAESGASAMQATPVTWRLLLAAGWAGAARLKVLCGGEALPRELAAELLAKAGQVWNLYGPTETTIWSTVHRVSARAGAVPIGRPIANTSVRVLDAHQQLVPVGVWGELYIGGRGVARGYFKRPELTAERFVADPVAPDSGERLYRTGDLVRYLADGSLEFQGRMDDQVKVRGFRIELGEIEAALARHPAVRDQAVVVRADASAEGRLVAYVVLEAESALAELGNFLRMKLPGYMVPAVFVPLAKLPVTPNGKVDRRALPAPAPVRPQLGTGFAAPRDALEQLLAHTYAAVLGVDRVGIHDNFFELGGASLSSLEIAAQLHEAGVPLPAEWIFEYQTIAQLAAAAVRASASTPDKPSAKEKKENRRVGT